VGAAAAAGGLLVGDPDAGAGSGAGGVVGEVLGGVDGGEVVEVVGELGVGQGGVEGGEVEGHGMECGGSEMWGFFRFPALRVRMTPSK
jgi:hypothetical protein